MYIYKIEHIDTGKIYIGKTTRSLDEMKRYYGSGRYIKAAVTKHGKDKFQQDIIEVCEDLSELNERERYWIDSYNSMVPNGYNIHEGGGGGDSFSHLTESEQAEIWDRRNKLNPDMYKKVWETRRKNGTDKFTEIHYQNIVRANRERGKNPEFRDKLRNIQLTNSAVELIYKIMVIPTGEIVEVKNQRGIKEFVDTYNRINNKPYKKRSNWVNLIRKNLKSTTDMVLLETWRANV